MMKLYICQDGSYAGTQADAKLRGKNFEPVEVPTDKEGLLAYLNQMLNAVEDLRPADEFTSVVERQDPPIEDEEPRRAALALDLNDLFERAPLNQQLTLAGIAIENARDQVRPDYDKRPTPAPQGYAGSKPRVETPADDELFS